MSRSLALAALAVLTLAGWLAPASFGQQKKFSRRAQPTASQNKGKITETQHLPRGQGVAKPPRNTLQLTPPKFPSSIPPERRPAAFGPAATLPAVKTITLPKVDQGKPMGRSGSRQRPIEPGRTPAGDPRIAGGRLKEVGQTRLDPAVSGIQTSQGSQLSGATTFGRHARPSGPIGNAAAAVGQRGLAADERAPTGERQAELYGQNMRTAMQPGSPLLVDRDHGITRLFPAGEGTGWTRQYWNNQGELAVDTTRFIENPDGTTTVVRSSIQPNDQGRIDRIEKRTTVNGPIASWDHASSNEIRRGGPSSGELKTPRANNGPYTTTVTVMPYNQGSSGNPKPAGNESKPANDKPPQGGGSKPDDKGPPPQNDKPVKEPNSQGGPKDASSPGVEGGGTGVDGRTRRLPPREDRVDVYRSGPPISVVQPTGHEPNGFGSGRRIGRIEAPEFRRGGYIPTTPEAPRGQRLAAQPYEQEHGRSRQQINNRSYAERIQEAVVNPYDR